MSKIAVNSEIYLLPQIKIELEFKLYLFREIESFSVRFLFTFWISAMAAFLSSSSSSGSHLQEIEATIQKNPKSTVVAVFIL